MDDESIEKFTTEIVLQGFSSTLILLDARNSGTSGGHDAGSSSSNVPNFDNSELDDEIPF